MLTSQVPRPEALMERLGGFHRATETKVPLAQRYFDQGLACLYGYQYTSARRSFQQACKLDPECAMAYWGEAFSYGPDINFPEVNATNSAAALTALDKADHAKNASALERKLITAQRLRFSAQGPSDRRLLNKSYTNAMRTLWHEYPSDPDVAAMFAEGILDEHPWRQWTLDGKPNPGTLEALQAIRGVLAKHPRHPMALHLYIHALESSPRPGDALVAADTLEGLQPDLAHMQHMPCHIYAHVGQWEKAVDANQKAIAQDRAYLASRGITKAPWPNVDHYGAALAYAAGMRGLKKIAYEALDIDGFSTDWIAKEGTEYDGDLAMPLMVKQQFGDWDAILQTKDFPANVPTAQTMLWGARTIAHSALGQLKEAEECWKKMRACIELIPADKGDGVNLNREIMRVELHLARGEFLVRRPDTQNEGIREISEAVFREDHLAYAEPPPWLMPARHALGAALLYINKPKEAEPVFRKQLQLTPNDGWALIGLTKSLRAQGKTAEAARWQAKFEQAWKNADVSISTSCMCLEPAKQVRQ